MKRFRRLSLVIFSLGGLATGAFAQAITGVVTNGTNGKPAAGVEVVLVDPMQEWPNASRPRRSTSREGLLSRPALRRPATGAATRHGVNYFRIPPPGTSTSA